MTADDPGESDDEVARALRRQLLDLPTLLRFGAFVFVLVGFFGALETDASPVAADSAFSLLFYLGIACAVASIYLAMYRQRPGGESDDG
ncbi:hypothetical protein [Natrononativus amylolyticus]|uniref:hypothetical protein n=1 Tax=Natrononativus amylolyticus TaxID=2963434 RepID=UPI0020CDB0D9|nr:hypothetical protein [Natrononativus amylolyticus]